MNASISRIDHALETALRPLVGAPPRLTAAIRHAVFPGGARFRPRLCLAVARACGDASPALALAAATAIELLHCASLVLDDLPCFDDAALRRGQPTVHAVYGDALAVLAGNALIVRAFELLGEAAGDDPLAAARILAAVARGVGAPHGITAGQAWEAEPRIDLRAYHRAKTGALFEAAVIAGAIAGGGDPAAWEGLGGDLGEAYQVADDLGDLFGCSEHLGKPVGQDSAHRRPSAAHRLGPAVAATRMHELFDAALRRVPLGPGRPEIVALVTGFAERLTAPLPRPEPSACASAP